MHSEPVALITGASRGIGRAIARNLAADNYAVCINYLKNRDAANSLAEEITSTGGTATICPADVGSEPDRQGLLDHIGEQFGRLDLLVNNAGITSQGRMDLLELTASSWERVFATNLKGPFFLAQQAAKQMISQIQTKAIPRGTIINISSISAYATSANRADYCMAKAAIQMMTWLFADRLASENIWVYEVCPGVIKSDMTAPVEEKYDRLIADGLTPIRRWGTPEDVARAVCQLASDTFSFTTGERINVDGGFHIRRL